MGKISLPLKRWRREESLLKAQAEFFFEEGRKGERQRIVDYLKKQGAVWVDQNYAIIEAIESDNLQKP